MIAQFIICEWVFACQLYACDRNKWNIKAWVSLMKLYDLLKAF